MLIHTSAGFNSTARRRSVRHGVDDVIHAEANAEVARTCLVSFTDANNIRHAVEVAASTLYDAATLAMAEFRRCGSP